MILDFDVHNTITQFETISFLWTQQNYIRWNWYDESSRTVVNLDRKILIMSVLFLRLKAAQSHFIYLKTIVNSQQIEVLWFKRSLSVIMCDMYSKDLIHFSQERYVFDSTKVDLSTNFVAVKNFKLKDALIDRYYVNEANVLNEISKLDQISFTVNVEFYTSSRRFYFLREILKTDLTDVSTKVDRSELKEKVESWLRRKAKQLKTEVIEVADEVASNLKTRLKSFDQQMKTELNEANTTSLFIDSSDTFYS